MRSVKFTTQSTRVYTMDTTEAGEISLDDVSSSEETNHNNWLKKEQKLDMDKKYDKRVEVDILPQDAVYGKENRQYSNELHSYGIKPKPPPFSDLPKDGLLPISSEDESAVTPEKLSNGSNQLIITNPGKRKKRKKKKKKTGQRLLVLDDLESAIEPPTMPTRITGDYIVSPLSDYDSSELHKKYSPPSAKHHRSSINHCKTNSHHPRTLSPRRRSPRRLSPEKSNLMADRHSQHKSFKQHSSRHDDKYKLLKKLRQLDNRHEKDPIKDQSSNKLHILKSNSGSYLQKNGHLGNHREMVYDVEDEEDVDKLRRAALETKLQKNDRKDIEIIKDSKTESEDNSNLNYNVDDQDEEDLELRMIALRSAFQNKHRDRIQRGVASKNKDINKRDRSPSSDSLIDDLFNDFSKEPIAAEDVDVEDINLDSDVEKENQPYSPTDGLSDDKYSDTEAIEPPKRVPLHSNPPVPRTEYHAPVPIYNQEFYPQPNRIVHHESTYPPSDSIQPSVIDKYLRTDQFNYNASYIRTMPLRTEAIPTDSHVETPYSPTDTPAFDPELPVCPSELSFIDNVTNTNRLSYPNSSYLNNPMLRPHNNGPNYIPPRTELNESAITPTSSHFTRDPRRAAALSRGLISISTQSQKTIHPEQLLMKPVEKSTEVVNTDPRLHGILAASKHKPDERFDEIIKSLAEYNAEPAYLQGVPHVTKDANKIPTLVNRTLVPAPILRTNKQLQQKLPVKKTEDTTEKTGDTTEKTFKNAEMHSVEITRESTNTSTFRPIKLPIKIRKIQLIDVPIKGFNSMNESSTFSGKGSDNSGVVDLSQNTEILTTEVDGKKRGRGRPKTPTIRKINAKKSPIKDSNKSSTKSIGRRSKANNKEVANPLAEKEKPDENDVKKSRGKSRSRSVNKSEKNEEENKKRETIHRAAKEKTSKISELNSKENDNIRRSSVDEDEEALRASVLASMYTSGLKKIRDDIIDKTKINSTKDKSSITSSTFNEKATSISTSKNNSTLTNTISSVLVNNKNSTARNAVTNTPNTLMNARKRPGTTDVFGPPEKVLKKTPITAKNPLDNLSKHLTAPASPKMSKNVSRVIINLGEDTDSESDVSDHFSPSPSKRLNVSSTDFDKKVDEFLKSQREKLEVNSKVISTPKGNKTAASVTQKTSVLGSTPLAVRHLPVSKQEEYRRLKQQLAEKEKQKLIRATEKILQKSTKVALQSAEKKDQVTATNLQVKKTMNSSQSATAFSISTFSSSNNQKVFTNIPQPSKISSSFIPVSENLHSPTNIYPNNLMDTSLTEELMLPLDFTTKPDPDDFLTITEEPKVNPLIIANVSQNCSDEINYDMSLENLGLRENLVIQISNIQDDSITGQRKVIFAKDFDFTKETTPHTQPKEAIPSIPPTSVLKILTTAQLNMKIQQETPSTSLKEMEEKVRLDENKQVIMPNTQSLIEHNNLTGNLPDEVSPIVPKSEPMLDTLEQYMPISSIQVESATKLSTIAPVQVNINTTESVSLLPPKAESEVEPPTQSETVTPINVIKCEVEEHLTTYNKLPLEQQKTELSKIENDLVKKRYNVLSDVTEMIENLQRWEKEQNIRIKLAADVAKLRLELKTAEERFEDQKFKVSNMGPKIRKAHSKINTGRSECVKLIKLCQGLGTSISGDEYKSPDIGADALTNKLRDIANYTQQLFMKKEALNKQNHHMGLTSSVVHKNVCQSNDVGIASTSEQQSIPLNLSVQPTPEVNKNLSVVKIEESENQDFNSVSTTTPILNSHSTLVNNSTSIINFSSVAEFTSNDSPRLPVQADVSVNISQNQVVPDKFSLSKVKSEPADVNETDFENIPMEVDNENETTKDTQFTRVVSEPFSKIKTEKTDDEEINESISIFHNTALKQEENDDQSKESYKNISSNNISIRIIPSERLIERKVKNKIREGNAEAINEQPSHFVDVNNKTVELKFDVDSRVCKSEALEIEERLDNDQVQAMEVYSVSDNLLMNELENGQTRNERVKCETDSLLSSQLNTNNINIVGQVSERGTEATVNMTQDTWAEFEEEKLSVTGAPYESVLTAFNTIRPVDPNGVLCPFELMGTCKDDSCTYNHLNADRKI